MYSICCSILSIQEASIFFYILGVECGPTNVTITPNPDEPLASGDAVTLQCSAVDPTESVLSFQWFKDDHLSPGQLSSALVLDAVGQIDTGTYTCQVSNRLGMKKQTFDLSLKFQGETVKCSLTMYVLPSIYSTSCTSLCVIGALRILFFFLILHNKKGWENGWINNL